MAAVRRGHRRGLLLLVLRQQDDHDRRRRHGDDRDADLAERMRLMSLHGLSQDAWKRYSGGGKLGLPDRRAGLQVQPHRRRRRDRHPPACAAPRRCARRARRSPALLRKPSPGADELELPPMPRGPDPRLASVSDPAAARSPVHRPQHRSSTSCGERGVGCSVHWRPLHLHPYYAETFRLAARGPSRRHGGLGAADQPADLPGHARRGDRGRRRERPRRLQGQPEEPVDSRPRLRGPACRVRSKPRWRWEDWWPPRRSSGCAPWPSSSARDRRPSFARRAWVAAGGRSGSSSSDRCASADRGPARHGSGRRPGDAGRPLPAPHQARRAAGALERAARRHVLRRSAAGGSRVRRRPRSKVGRDLASSTGVDRSDDFELAGRGGC